MNLKGSLDRKFAKTNFGPKIAKRFFGPKILYGFFGHQKKLFAEQKVGGIRINLKLGET